MPPTVQIEIIADEGPAGAALDELNAKAAALTPTLQQVGATSSSAFSQMQANIHSTRMTTDLLTGNVQRAEQSLVRMAAATSAIGPLISKAFYPFALITFAELIGHTVEGFEKLVGATKQDEEAMRELAAANEETHRALQAQTDDANKLALALALVGKTGTEAMQIQTNYAHLAAASQEASLNQLVVMQTAQQKVVDDLKKQLQEAQAAITAPTLGEPGSQALFGQTLSAGLQRELKAAETALAQINDLVETQQTKFRTADNAATLYDQKLKEAFGAENQANIASMNKQLDDQQRALEKLQGANARAAVQQYEQDLRDWQKQEEDFNAAIQTSFKTVADERNQERLATKALDDALARSEQEQQRQAEEAARSWTRARDTMASQLNSFFDELTTGNIGRAFLRQFEKMVSEMVATWLMGIRGMQQSVTRPGGLFGTLFGMGSGSGFFGGGDLTNPAYPAGGALSGALGGGAYSFSGLGSELTGPVANMQLPLSAGGGGGGLGIGTLPTGSASLGPGLAGLGGGGFLSKLFGGGGLGSLAGMGLIAGAAMEGIGFNSPGQGALTGALGAGLGMGALAYAGTAIPGLFGAGEFAAAALSGPFFPITLGIGALIGGLVGLFTGHGKRKKEQTALLQQMERDLNNLQNAFGLHQIDYNSAINQAEQIRQSFTAQQEQLQSGGGPSRVDPWVNATETYINNIEAQRQQVLSSIGGYGPAQFDRGGFVHPSMARLAPAGFQPAMAFAMGGAVPAIVHAGEYVLNAGAVTKMGVGTLDRMNAGGFGGVHVHLTVNALDGKSVEELFAPGSDGWRALSRTFSRALSEGRM